MFSKCFNCFLIATFCFEMWNIFEHVLRYFIIDNNYKLLTFQRVDVYLNERIEIHELIELANQSNQQVKGALVIEAAKITEILMKAKNELVIRSIEIKEEAKKNCFDQKKTYQSWKTHCFNGFYRISQRIRRFGEQKSLLWPISTKWTS